MYKIYHLACYVHVMGQPQGGVDVKKVDATEDLRESYMLSIGKTTKILAASAVLAFGLGGAAAAAPLIFTVNPGVIGSGASSFEADEMVGGYSAEIDQFDDGSFIEHGYAAIQAFQLNGIPNSIPAFVSGLGADYLMYALFRIEGQVVELTANEIQVNFTSFLAEIWVDPMNAITGSSVDVVHGDGIDQTGFSGQNAGSQFADAGGSAAFTLNNTDDDILVLEILGGDFLNGVANVEDNGNAGIEGNFQVRSGFNTEFFGFDALDFFEFLQPILALTLQANGNTGNEDGIPFPPAAAQDVVFRNASLNITFIPEPGTLGLLGFGLFAAGALASRRRKMVA